MQTSSKKLTQTKSHNLLTQMSTVLADFSQPKEVEQFLSDFFTETEIKVFTKRLGILWQLHQGNSYEAIKKDLHVSSATIASTSEQLHTAGIVSAIKNIKLDQWAEKITGFFKF